MSLQPKLPYYSFENSMSANLFRPSGITNGSSSLRSCEHKVLLYFHVACSILPYYMHAQSTSYMVCV